MKLLRSCLKNKLAKFALPGGGVRTNETELMARKWTLERRCTRPNLVDEGAVVGTKSDSYGLGLDLIRKLSSPPKAVIDVGGGVNRSCGIYSTGGIEKVCRSSTISPWHLARTIGANRRPSRQSRTVIRGGL